MVDLKPAAKRKVEHPPALSDLVGLVPDLPIKKPVTLNLQYRDLLVEAKAMLLRVEGWKMVNGKGRHTGDQIRALIQRIEGVLE